MVRLRPGDQPTPTHVDGEISSHQWVINDLAERRLIPGLLGAACTRIEAREQLGIDRYGTILQPGNGRDAMRDAWEETVDQVVYLATAIREGQPVHNIYEMALATLLKIVAYIDGIN